MDTSYDIWKLLTGVAFFLLAMNFLEDTLRHLAGRRFKLFLKKQTKNKVKAIGSGAVVSGLLQSSSIVNLLVLSMVGASVLKMENALAIILGSNLGTTFSSWLVATLGFNFNTDAYALPVAGIAGVIMAFINNDKKLYLWFKFIFSLAFLFIALGFIKSGMEEFVRQTDLSVFNKYPVIVFLLLGVVLTTIIQSSSATIALTLSALYVDAITFYVATAIVLGSEIGTTFKLFLASAKGLVAKKRVALGNFLFNIITVSIVFILLRPINFFLTDLLLVKDNLIALVLFQSLVNLISIILFYPFLQLFGRFLLNRFVKADEEGVFISKVPVADPGLALEALENETKLFIHKVIDYSVDSFDLESTIRPNQIVPKKFLLKPVSEKYELIKQSHGQMHAFYLRLQSESSDKPETERLEQLIAATRNMMYAAKNIRDAQDDILQTSNSSNDLKYNFYKESRGRLLTFYQQVFTILNIQDRNKQAELLSSLYQSVTSGYTDTLHTLYKENLAKQLSQIEISTLINFNRELYTSFKSVVFGLKDFLLTNKEAEFFETLPGFIR